MGTLSSVFWIYCSLCSHTAWQKAIFIENCCFWKWIKLKNNLQPWPYFRTCRTSRHPGLIYSPALILFRGNVLPWPYILARPSIWHVREHIDVWEMAGVTAMAANPKCAYVWPRVCWRQLGGKNSERPRGAGIRSVNPAERWRENPVRALARAGFSQHLNWGINRSESSPEGSFAFIPHPVARWAITTPIQFVLPLATFYRSGTQRSNVYKRDVSVTSWRFHNRAWPPVRDTVNPLRGFDQSAMLTSYRVWD